VDKEAAKMSTLLSKFRRPAPVEKGSSPDVVPEGFTPITQFLPEDIIIVGYPKSGNTWLKYLVLGVVYGVDPRWMPHELAQELVPSLAFPGDKNFPRKYYRRYATPMFFQSHTLPRAECRRVVYVLRDGRDVLVSYRHYREALDGVEYDFLKFVSEIYLYPCPWGQHVDAWMENPFGAQLLVIKFEDLLHEPVRELKRFCEFAGISRDTQHLMASAEAASFHNLRDREARMGHAWPGHSFPRDKFFFRRGEIGSYMDEMPAKVQEKFLENASESMRRCGYLTDSAAKVNREAAVVSTIATALSAKTY
jgi:Sulfotransferase domain